MVKKWVYRIAVLVITIFIIAKTRQFYNSEVKDYLTAQAEQRAIWDQKAENNRIFQEQQAQKKEQKEEPDVEEAAPEVVFEPSEATGDDFFLDLGNYSLWESGEYSFEAGEKADQRRRLRYPELIEIECPEYFVVLSEGYTVSICEYDSQKTFIRKVMLKNGEKYSASKYGAYFSITLRRDENEKSLSPGQWSNIFSEGIDVKVLTQKWLE